MVYLFLALLAGWVIYLQARKGGVPPLKWVGLGLLAVAAPLVVVPYLLHKAVGRTDFDGSAILLGIVGAMAISASVRRKARPEPPTEAPDS